MGPDPRLSRSGRPVVSPKPTGPVRVLPPLCRTRARRWPRIKPGFPLPPPAHLAKAVEVVCRLQLRCSGPEYTFRSRPSTWPRSPWRARLDQLTAASTSHYARPRPSERSLSVELGELSIAALFGRELDL